MNKLELRAVRDYMLLTSNAMLYPHILGVFSIMQKRIDNGEPILNDKESNEANKLRIALSLNELDNSNKQD